MSETNIIMRLKLKKGVAEFVFPRGMRPDNYRSTITCHALICSDLPGKVGYVVCNASYYSPQENEGYKFNILAAFESSTPPIKVLEFPGTIQAPLNRLHSSIQLYTMDEEDNLMPLNGYLVVELSGNVAVSTLM